MGLDAGAFSVSPELAAGSVDVQVLVKEPEMVDYEKKTEMVVQVRGALVVGIRGPGAVGPYIAAFSCVLRSWPLTQSVRTPPSPW